MKKKKIVAIGNLCIPHEMIFEILKQVPAKSLMRFRCVSKSFCSLISEPLFIEAHQKFSTAQFHVSCSSLTTSKDVIQYLNQSRFSKLHSLASTNGLVCLWNFDGDVAVSNPFTQEHIFLPYQQSSITCCSLGFDSTTKKYKVIKAQYLLDDRDSGKVRYWIYTIGVDKLWREIPDCANIFPAYSFVYIDGVTYCVNRLSESYNIAAFSVKNEKLIRMILSPDGVWASKSPPNIVEINGQVALVDQSNSGGKVSLYVLNGTGETETWVKHIIALPSELINTKYLPLFKTNPKGEIALPLCTVLDMFLYDIAKKDWRKVDIHEIYERVHRVSWVGVLLNLVENIWSLK
ncbi:putative F-box protein At1g32420 [Nicotiana tabacum]|uniref:F-box protein At1g32420 n=1 Tax=Nicotiana tabacum TaxID=4097 RepID=A0A1S3Z6D8_TOBAC|nr:PREDICTED: putative F-box protein At1g32420 [Nicotiana tabacum]